MTRTIEEWRDVAGFPGYSVSSHGRVRRTFASRTSRAGLFISISNRGVGYLRVSLQRNGVRHSVSVHCLVCEAFQGPRPSAVHEAAHRDGSRTNNFNSNLSWKTKKDNAADRDLHGTTARGERQGSAKLTAEQVKLILSDERPATLISAQYGVSAKTIRQIKRGVSWRHVPRRPLKAAA